MSKRSRTDDSTSPASDDSLPYSAASPAKIQELEVDELTAATLKHRMQCSLPPHPPLTFASTNDFDVHYAKEHTNRCLSCGKNFPSAHYLTLHIDENHNPVREALAAQGQRTYACFVDGCDRKCSTPPKRRLHLIDKHSFPKAYNFRIIDQGIDRTGSLLLTGQRRRLSTTTQSLHLRRSSILSVSTPSVDESVADIASLPSTSYVTPSSAVDVVAADVDAAVNDLEHSLAALRFVPPSVQAKQRGKRLGK